MSGLDRDILAERAMVVRRHLARVAERLPDHVDELRPATDASDVVILHLWQAVQVVIDLAVAACVSWDLGAPPSYAGAFRRLAAGRIGVGWAYDTLRRVAAWMRGESFDASHGGERS